MLVNPPLCISLSWKIKFTRTPKSNSIETVNFMEMIDEEKAFYFECLLQNEMRMIFLYLFKPYWLNCYSCPTYCGYYSFASETRTSPQNKVMNNLSNWFGFILHKTNKFTSVQSICCNILTFDDFIQFTTFSYNQIIDSFFFFNFCSSFLRGFRNTFSGQNLRTVCELVFINRMSLNLACL